MVTSPEGTLPAAAPEASPPLSNHRCAPRHRRRSRTPLGLTEGRLTVVVLVALMAGSVAAHDPRRMLTQPLWRDESWVAVTLRAPFGQILSLTSTTPLLFTALLRVTPHWSPSSLRLLPLAFTVAAVVPAWYLGREIDHHGWGTRVTLAAGVAFAPAMLMRHDLKQYTAEAFDALVILWLVARLESKWSRRRLIVLGVVLAASTLLSNGAVFLGPAVLAALAVVLVARRAGRRLVELGIVAAGTLAIDLIVFLAVDQRADVPTLRTYWQAFYIPTSDGVANALHFVHFQSGAELQSVGLGPSLVVLALVAAGVATLATTGFPALAIVVPLTTIEQLAAAAAQRYPLWDSRTSTWYTVVLTVMALIGVVGAARLAWFLFRHSGWPPARVVGVVAGAALVGLVVALTHPYLHAARVAVDTTTPLEDVQGQVQTIEAEQRPGDVVVSNVDAGFGLGVYWPAQPEFLFRQARLETFRIAFPPADRVVVATTISTPAEVDAVRRAVTMAAATPRGRVWVVLSHWHVSERATMVAALTHYGVLTTPPGQHGLEPVQLLTLRRPVTTFPAP